MRPARLVCLALSLTLALPTVGWAAPVTSPPQILKEDFESAASTQYMLEKVAIDSFADGNHWWGRTNARKYKGLYSLWCSASPSSSGANYAEGSSGNARFVLPQLADYYSATLQFAYNLPSQGVSDDISFGVHSRPVGFAENVAETRFPLTTATQWVTRSRDLAAGDSPISREPGEVWFRWTDINEGYQVTPRVGVGASIDDVVISGWKYGPARNVEATALGRSSAKITWLAPFSAVGSSVVETRPVLYDVYAQVAGGSTWTTVATGAGSTAATATGLAPSTKYTFAVQPRDAAAAPGTGYGEYRSAGATTSANHAPTAVADAYAVAEDQSLIVGIASGVLANDTDADGDIVSVAAIVQNPAHGTLSVTPVSDGSFGYVPSPDFYGVDSFTYRVTDSLGATAVQTVTITVTPVNDVPVATADAYRASVGTTLSVPAPGVLQNDTDSETVPAVVPVTKATAHGSVAMSANGGFTYVPAPGYSGSDSFTYTVTDGVVTATGTVALTVAGAQVSRIDGSDRFAVAAALARKGWDPSGAKAWTGVNDVIVANGEAGKEADPLAAAGLAGALDAPVLLVRATGVPTPTKAVLTEIAAKNPGVKVYVIGGTASVPATVWNTIKAIPGVSATDNRIAGKNRFDVTAKIAQKMVSVLGSNGVAGALIVNAENPAAFYDALAVSPQAYQGHWAMLGVRAGAVPPEVAAVLNGSLAGKPRHVVSGTMYVGEGVRSATGASPVRYATSGDLYTAATQIGDKVAANSGCSAAQVGVAAKLPDALTGGVFLGKKQGIMLFTDSTATLRPVTKNYITAHKSDVLQGWVLGGPNSVQPAQLTAFANIVK